jgi:photosystem II stability/assembly factor-like uncharacterized protein
MVSFASPVTTEKNHMKFILTGILLLTTFLSTECLLAQDFDAFEYRNVGPSRGGRVTAVAGTVAAPSTFYLGASGGGVWKTEDYGTTWKVVSDGYFETPSIGDIAVAQNDANIVYVGTGSDGLRSNVIAGKGVYKSIDGGTTWEHIGLRETGHIGAVEIDPTNHNIVWVAAIGQAFNANEERGVYKTEDGGKTWDKVLFVSDTVGFADIELLPGNPDIVFAAAWKAERKPWTIISGGSQEEGGLYKSEDGGKSWEKITEGLPQGLIGDIDLAISAADSSIVYALVEAPDDDGGLYRSVDQGRTFEQMSDDERIRNRPFYYGNIEADPQNADIVYSLAGRFVKSEDGGATWTRVIPPHDDNHDMWINPDNPDRTTVARPGRHNSINRQWRCTRSRSMTSIRTGCMPDSRTIPRPSLCRACRRSAHRTRLPGWSIRVVVRPVRRCRNQVITTSCMRTAKGGSSSSTSASARRRVITLAPPTFTDTIQKICATAFSACHRSTCRRMIPKLSITHRNTCIAPRMKGKHGKPSHPI